MLVWSKWNNPIWDLTNAHIGGNRTLAQQRPSRPNKLASFQAWTDLFKGTEVEEIRTRADSFGKSKCFANFIPNLFSVALRRWLSRWLGNACQVARSLEWGSIAYPYFDIEDFSALLRCVRNVSSSCLGIQAKRSGQSWTSSAAHLPSWNWRCPVQNGWMSVFVQRLTTLEVIQ